MTGALTTLPGGISDKLGHFIGYALLGALVLRAVAGAHVAGVRAATIGLAIAISLLYGASDEGHQHFVHGRVPDVADWGADALGALAAIAVCAIGTRLVAGRRARSRAV